MDPRRRIYCCWYCSLVLVWQWYITRTHSKRLMLKRVPLHVASRRTRGRISTVWVRRPRLSTLRQGQRSGPETHNKAHNTGGRHRPTNMVLDHPLLRRLSELASCNSGLSLPRERDLSASLTKAARSCCLSCTGAVPPVLSHPCLSILAQCPRCIAHAPGAYPPGRCGHHEPGHCSRRLLPPSPPPFASCLVVAAFFCLALGAFFALV